MGARTTELVVILAPTACALAYFIIVWVLAMKATLRYYSASLPLTLRQRGNLAAAYMTGNLLSTSKWLSEQDKTALPYLPEVASAWKRILLVFLLIPAGLAISVCISLLVDFLIGK